MNGLNQLAWRWDGEPFGAGMPDEYAAVVGQQFVFNLRFPGQYYDKKTREERWGNAQPEVRHERGFQYVKERLRRAAEDIAKYCKCEQ